MSNILVVLGSIRPNRVADKMLEHINADLQAREDVSVSIADLKELAMPFFDGDTSPMSGELVVTDENVKQWAKMVGDADGVVLVMPEYNHSMTAVQKNAIDWLYAEWNDKPIAAISYGWTGGSLALATAKEVLSNVQANLLPTPAQLAFMKQINIDGTAIDQVAVDTAIHTALDELVAASK